MASERKDSAGESPYSLPNAGEQARPRFGALESLYDAPTIAHLERCGVSPGWRCLEVGGGSGSIARWLADRVGPAGWVLTTDIDTRFLDPLAGPTLEVRRHDIAAEPLPEAAFDLVHTRLVLHHLPGRAEALRRMVGALRPGGWIVVEEFDWTTMDPDPAEFPALALFRRVGSALQRVMTERGADGTYGRQLWWRLRAHGLVDVGAEGRVSIQQGGSPGAQLALAGVDQLREAVLRAGSATEQDIEAFRALLADPDFAYMSPVMVTAWGRRPVG
jgi:SAM-dependent methyltransferase